MGAKFVFVMSMVLITAVYYKRCAAAVRQASDRFARFRSSQLVNRILEGSSMHITVRKGLRVTRMLLGGKCCLCVSRV